MEQERLRSIAEGYLRPLFSGAWLADAVPSTPTEHRVARLDPRSLAFKVEAGDPYRLVLRRSEKFGQTAEQIVKSFVDVLREIEPALSTAFEADVLRTLQRKVLSRTVAGAHMRDAMLSGIDWLEGWAERPYEGHPVAVALGFDQGAKGGDLALQDLFSLEFSAVLGNDADTMLWVDGEGRVVGHECLPTPEVSPSFAPYSQAAFASWAVEGRVVLALTLKGEMLVFRDSQLLFAKRSGRWHFLTHRPIVTRMPAPQSVAVRRAIYESCLDVSFSGQGACLGVVMNDRADRWEEVVTEGDRLNDRQSLKARALQLLIAGRSFAELDRRFRLELLSIDGALILDHRGMVLAVGAILKIPAGSTGGGRLAAARVLASLGLGIKVSQDGSIVCFNREQDQPVFSLM